jgi:O-antigen/teichoic acid export membrane protein
MVTKLKFLKNIFNTHLFKITSLNSVSVVLKLFIGLITSKVIAVFIGPSGLALVGNFRNFVATFETLSTLGFTNGIVKYVAESKEKETELKKYISTVCITISGVSFFLGIILFFFSDYWNSLVFGIDFSYSFLFKAFAIALPWYALSFILVSIVNGLGKFNNVIYISIIGNCIGLIVSVLFVYNLQTVGALLAIILTPSLLFFISFFYVNQEISLLDSVRFRFFDFSIIKKLFHYFLMAFVSGIVGSIVLLTIRKNIIATIGIQEAGYWEAMTRISTYYLLFISTILTLYFLPKLTVSNSNIETKKIVWSYYTTIFPIFIIGLIFVYFSRFFIVKILFTSNFIPVTTLFFWQLIGDLLKMASWILGYQFFAKRLTVAFIITELFSLIIIYFFGVEGVVMAHAMTYLIYLIVLGIYFRKSLFY